MIAISEWPRRRTTGKMDEREMEEYKQEEGWVRSKVTLVLKEFFHPQICPIYPSINQLIISSCLLLCILLFRFFLFVFFVNTHQFIYLTKVILVKYLMIQEKIPLSVFETIEPAFNQETDPSLLKLSFLKCLNRQSCLV